MKLGSYEKRIEAAVGPQQRSGVVHEMPIPFDQPRDNVEPVILGKLAEGSFHQALMISDHDYSVFFLRPLSASIFALCIVLVAWPGVKRRLGRGGAEAT